MGKWKMFLTCYCFLNRLLHYIENIFNFSLFNFPLQLNVNSINLHSNFNNTSSKPIYLSNTGISNNSSNPVWSTKLTLGSNKNNLVNYNTISKKNK